MFLLKNTFVGTGDFFVLEQVANGCMVKYESTCFGIDLLYMDCSSGDELIVETQIGELGVSVEGHVVVCVEGRLLRSGANGR